jgi:hypothetical protein
MEATSMLKAQYISNWRGTPRRPVLSTHLLETARTILSRVESLKLVHGSDGRAVAQ